VPERGVQFLVVIPDLVAVIAFSPTVLQPVDFIAVLDRLTPVEEARHILVIAFVLADLVGSADPDLLKPVDDARHILVMAFVLADLEGNADREPDLVDLDRLFWLLPVLDFEIAMGFLLFFKLFLLLRWVNLLQ